MSVVYRMKEILHENFHALSHKNFRYFWVGQCVSLIGTWMQNIGQSWLVYTLTGSSFLLGVVGSVQFLPMMVFSLFAGVAIDRFPKRKLILFTQTSAMILAFVMAILVFTHRVAYWQILILAFLLGCVNTLDMPSRQAFMVEIVGKEDLMNAVALNSAVFNLARIVGPAIAGVVMAYVGTGWCFLLNGLSFLAVLYGLLQINIKGTGKRKEMDTGILGELTDGLKYISKNSEILQTILLVAVVGIFAYNFNVLLPVYTSSILHQGEKTYGVLMSCLGIGSLIGALALSMKSRSGPRTTNMVISALLISLLLALTGFSKIFYLTAVILAVNGIFNIGFSTNANSTLQLISKDEYRGRVMSVYTLVFAGTTPIGNLFAGYTSEKLGVSAAYILSGILNLAFILLLLLIFRRRRKPGAEGDGKLA